MPWKKILGYGALLWIIMFVFVSALIGFKIYGPLWSQILTAAIGGAIAFIFAGYAKPENFKNALFFGLGWVIVGVVLDAIITMRFSPKIFTEWPLWLSYLLVLVAPLTRTKKQ